jgi:hypothetical protein
VRLRWLFYFVLVLPVCSLGQGSDAEITPADSTLTYFDDTNEEQEDSQAAVDTSSIDVRDFNGATLKELKADNSLQYKEAPTIAESLWDRFLALLEQFFDSLFRNALNTDWGRVFSIVLGIVLLVVIIMMILKVNAFKVFYDGQGASTMPYSVLDENIHEMNFDKLIQEAIAQHDYRKAIRLLFLKSLKMLADKNYIHWEQGKTNHDYLSELSAADLKKGFHQLNFYFEYAWYGNFSVTHDMFVKIQGVFTEWKNNVR